MSDVQHLSLAGIAQRCAHESELFFHRQSHDPRYCFELFRRAIVDRNPDAWTLVYAQYHRLVTGWAARHPMFEPAGEETCYLVNRAFEKMWSALTPDKFGHFQDLASILRYLQMCVHSVIIDLARSAEQSRKDVELGEEIVATGERGAPVEEAAFRRVQQEAFWDCVRSRLHGDKELQVIYGSFVLNLKPQELYAAYQATFRDVDEVYRIKQNVLERLRRDNQFRELVG